jgi:hypothetical protein
VNSNTFPVKKNLSFSLENNKINTYIHPNNREPVRLESISPSLIYNMTFPEFDEIDSLKGKIVIPQAVEVVIHQIISHLILCLIPC